MSIDDRFLSDALRRALVSQQELVSELNHQLDHGGFQIKNMRIGGFFDGLAFVVCALTSACSLW
jgi:hypothetical protein